MVCTALTYKILPPPPPPANTTTKNNKDNVIMWNPPGGMGAANTSVAILTVMAVFTPKDRFSSIDGEAVKAAVQATSEGAIDWMRWVGWGCICGGVVFF